MNQENLKNYFIKTLSMSDAIANELASKYKYQTINNKDFLLKIDMICNETYFIDEGLVRSYALDIDGNQITTNIYSAPCFANDFLSFFKREKSKENLQALSDCKVWSMTFEQVQESFHSIPEFREFGRMLLLNNYSTLKERMLGMIQLTAEQRYDKLLSQNPEIFQHLALKHIAIYLGITDTSLSRLRKNALKTK
jgi:CRP-like cAMP-binding protein